MGWCYFKISQVFFFLFCLSERDSLKYSLLAASVDSKELSHISSYFYYSFERLFALKCLFVSCYPDSFKTTYNTVITHNLLCVLLNFFLIANVYLALANTGKKFKVSQDVVSSWKTKINEKIKELFRRNYVLRIWQFWNTTLFLENEMWIIDQGIFPHWGL